MGTGFSHRLIDPIQNRGAFVLTFISWPRIMRSKIFFFRISNISATRSYAQLIFRTFIRKLWTFFGHWSRDHSQSPICWIFRLKRVLWLSTASARTARLWWRHQADSLVLNRLYNSTESGIHLVLRRHLMNSSLETTYWCIDVSMMAHRLWRLPSIKLPSNYGHWSLLLDRMRY